jgi:hypothetical protein
MTEPELKTIRGIVIPTDWHEDGHPRSVAIATYLEQKYTVAESSKCRQLMALLNQRVVVSGVVREANEGMLIDVGDFYLDEP